MRKRSCYCGGTERHAEHCPELDRLARRDGAHAIEKARAAVEERGERAAALEADRADRKRRTRERDADNDAGE